MDKTIKQIRDEAEEIESGWNGKDDQFVVGGVLYPGEDAVNCAKEIMDKCDELNELFRELNEYGKTF